MCSLYSISRLACTIHFFFKKAQKLLNDSLSQWMLLLRMISYKCQMDHLILLIPSLKYSEWNSKVAHQKAKAF